MGGFTYTFANVPRVFIYPSSQQPDRQLLHTLTVQLLPWVGYQRVGVKCALHAGWVRSALPGCEVLCCWPFPHSRLSSDQLGTGLPCPPHVQLQRLFIECCWLTPKPTQARWSQATALD